MAEHDQRPLTLFGDVHLDPVGGDEAVLQFGHGVLSWARGAQDRKPTRAGRRWSRGRAASGEDRGARPKNRSTGTGGGRCTIIDLPQAVDPRQNSQAEKLLERDLTNVLRYFARYKVEQMDPRRMAHNLFELWRHGEL